MVEMSSTGEQKMKTHTMSSSHSKTTVNGKTVQEDGHVSIEGKTIQFDASGRGHAWRNATSDNCPSHIQDEIAAEIIDGGKDESDGFTASNGQRYRWS
jgi:hypothetical protein